MTEKNYSSFESSKVDENNPWQPWEDSDDLDYDELMEQEREQRIREELAEASLDDRFENDWADWE